VQHAAIAAVALYVGADPVYVGLAYQAIPRVSIAGEETNYELPVAEGYAFCAARVSVVSLAPGGGDRASVINATAFEPHVHVYTWTGSQVLGGGNSWVEADVQVIGIRRYLAEFRDKGVCRAPPVRFLECRGNPCPSANFGNVEKAVNAAPALAEGF
jgi:hypothetical protein